MHPVMRRRKCKGEPMASKVCIIDTNVIVSSVIAADSDSPPARILEAMLGGDIPYLMSDALLREYSSVLHRPRLTRRHGGAAPDPGDAHLWALLTSHPQGQAILAAFAGAL